MNQPTHIIDPDGEVIIILRNADSPFAQALEDTVAGMTLPESGHCVQGPAEVIEPSPEVLEPPKPHSKRLKTKGKKGKKSRAIRISPAQPAPEPTPMEEPVAESALEPILVEDPAAEPAPEPTPMEEPVAESAPEPTPMEEPAAEPAPEPIPMEELAAEPAPEPTPMEEPVAESALEPIPVEDPVAELAPEPIPVEDPVAELAPEPIPMEEPAAEEEIYEPPVENCFYIQVSAKHLIFASPVFKRILTGGWKESIAYLQKGSVEITADNWDIEAFLVVLHAIHGKYKDIPRKLTLEILAKVAVIADYYECKESLYLITDIWLNNLEERIPTTYSRDSLMWVWVSWFFQLPSHFEESTSTVISCSENVISGWDLPISDKVIGLINKSREEAISNLVLLLHATRAALLSRSRGCSFECSSIMYGALTMQMESTDLLSPIPEAPFPSLNYNDLKQKVLSFTPPQWYHPPSSYPSYRGVYRHVCPDSYFESIFAKLNDRLQGLDLNSLGSL